LRWTHGLKPGIVGRPCTPSHPHFVPDQLAYHPVPIAIDHLVAAAEGALPE
jgi:hypothetical protein